jgi:predicted dehydrogenase
VAALPTRQAAGARRSWIDLERARKLGAELGAAATADAGQAFRGADAAIVAAPTRAHYELVRAALEQGLDVLVEKPIAATLAEAEAILELAIRRGGVLQVGHLEWFNPALREMRGKISEPRFIEARGSALPRARGPTWT